MIRLTILIFFIPCLSFTQIKSDSTTYNNRDSSAYTNARHHAGWAFSYAAGTATTGREAMMISTMYAYTFEDWCDIEASLHYVGRSENGQFRGVVRLHATSWTLEATPMLRFFKEGFFRSVRVGVGVSIHSLKYLENAKNLADPTLEYAYYSNVVYVGGTFKLEYSVPVSNRIDVGVRGQLSLYPLEFQGINQTIPANFYSVGLGGLGVFARFNW
jgi:hypothetical protein